MKFNFITNLFTKKDDTLIPPVISSKESAGVMKEDTFDLKALQVPKGSENAETIEYYVFCRDDRTENVKGFMYHKQVVMRCLNMAEAEMMARMFTNPYNHVALAYSVQKHDIVSDTHEGSKKLFLARIKEYRDRHANLISATHLAELLSAEKVTSTISGITKANL